MTGKSQFPEIVRMIREEAECLTALQKEGKLPLLATGSFTPFSVLAWLANVFTHEDPMLTRGEQRAFDDLLAGRSRESRYTN